MAREEGIPAGLLRPVVIWPFPEKRIRQLAGQAESFIVIELNQGQIVNEVERSVAGRAQTILVPHTGGAVHRPEAILDVIRKVAR
jgi:2-oxoglutarate ferredoxin oxidoreductase subunit alpha